MKDCQCTAYQLKKQQMENDYKSLPEINLTKNDKTRIKRLFNKILKEND